MTTSPVTHLVPLAERPLPERVAAAVRAEMARYNLRQVDLSRVLGITQQSTSPKYKGRVPYTLAEVEAVASWLGLTPLELVAAAETTKPRSAVPNGASGTSVRPEGFEPPTFWSVADGNVTSIDAWRLRRAVVRRSHAELVPA